MLVKFSTDYFIDHELDVWIEWTTGENMLAVMCDDCEIARHAIFTDGRALSLAGNPNYPTVGKAAEKARALLEAMAEEDRVATALLARDPHLVRDR